MHRRFVSFMSFVASRQELKSLRSLLHRRTNHRLDTVAEVYDRLNGANNRRWRYGRSVFCCRAETSIERAIRAQRRRWSARIPEVIHAVFDSDALHQRQAVERVLRQEEVSEVVRQVADEIREILKEEWNTSMALPLVDIVSNAESPFQW